MRTIQDPQMQVQPYPVDLFRLTLLLIGAILTFVAGASLLAQQPAAPPQAAVAPQEAPIIVVMHIAD